MSFVDDLRSNVNSILGLRDDLGAALKPVYIVTRTWSGDELGAGTKTDVQAQVLPSPRVVEFSQQYAIKEGGAVQQGDILLKGISQQAYATKNLVDCSYIAANIEKLYKVGGVLYRVIHVRERHLTWEVQLRQISKQ